MNYDVGIIGAGVAGAFAAFTIAKEYKNVKTIIFDLGRPPLKRRRQLEGWLGCLPNSDGKLYLNDINKVADVTGNRKSKSAYKYFENIISNINDFKITKDHSPKSSVEKNINKLGYNILLNDFIQTHPKDIHALSKHMTQIIESTNNVTYKFDNEIKDITCQKNMFTIDTGLQTYQCKKIIIAVGRSGWRWASNLYSKFGIIDNNDYSKFGIRIELNASLMKDFNQSNCSLFKNNEIEIGPFSWSGTVIPEDHVDLAISSFRSNENRWKTDKVSFNLIGNRRFPNAGFEQTDRIGKLTFILSNDRIIKEKVSSIISGKSMISIMPEYNWIKDSIEELSKIIPDIKNKSYYHAPTIIPNVPKINIGDNLSSEIDGMFVVGESAGISGILSAASTGIIAANSICA